MTIHSDSLKNIFKINDSEFYIERKKQHLNQFN